MKPINNYVDFLNEMDKGSKDIEVTGEFFKWLGENVGFSDMKFVGKEKIAIVCGVRVTKGKVEK